MPYAPTPSHHQHHLVTFCFAMENLKTVFTLQTVHEYSHNHVFNSNLNGAVIFFLSLIIASQSNYEDSVVWSILSFGWLIFYFSQLPSKGRRGSIWQTADNAMAVGKKPLFEDGSGDNSVAVSVGNPLAAPLTPPSEKNAAKDEVKTPTSSVQQPFVVTYFKENWALIITNTMLLMSWISWIVAKNGGAAFAAFIAWILTSFALLLRITPKDNSHGTRQYGRFGRICRSFMKGSLFFFTFTSALQAVALATQGSLYPPPGKLFDVQIGLYNTTSTVHIWCEGPFNAGPTVWYEHGWTGSCLDFSRVMTRTAKWTRSCSWDRPGYGWSNVGSFPRTSEHSMAEQALAHSAARDYIWGGPITPLVYVAHSMGGFHSRLYRDRNPERVGALVLCDPVNADSVEYPGILHQFPSTPSIQPSLTSLGLARILTWMRLPIFDAIFELPYQYQALYLNIIARAQWTMTSRDEWTWWPDNAQRCKETQPLGDLPLKVLVADASTALYPSETVKVAKLSTNSTIIHFPGQPHGFIMHAENEEKIESLIKDSWNTVIARNKKKVLGW